MEYVYMVLQGGKPMQQAERRWESDKLWDYWALWFASSSHGPTLFKTNRAAYNAIRRQRAREKKNGSALGRMTIMRVLLP